jgi:hypothetical protein
MSGLDNPKRFLVPSGNIHPSEIQNVNINAQNNIKNQRTIVSVQKERTTNYTDPNVTSPGKYNFSADNGDTLLAGSNTKYMFKNLYGETPLTFLYFSDKNVKNIQNLIRYLVSKEIGQNIDEQNNTELLIIMRSIFLEYSQHPELLDETMSPERRAAVLKLYTNEVDRLNQLVVNETVPRVISGVQQYLDYLRDSSQMPEQIARPVSVSTAGTRAYRSVTQVLSGNIL